MNSGCKIKIIYIIMKTSMEVESMRVWHGKQQRNKSTSSKSVL